MQRGEERGLRSLLVHGAAAHHDLAESGLVDERASQGGDDHSAGSTCFTSYMK